MVSIRPLSIENLFITMFWPILYLSSEITLKLTIIEVKMILKFNANHSKVGISFETSLCEVKNACITLNKYFHLVHGTKGTP